MKITDATKCIRQTQKNAHPLHGQCRLSSNMEHGYVPGNHPRDDIQGFLKKKKKNHIFTLEFTLLRF